MIASISTVGAATGRVDAATEIVEGLEARLRTLAAAVDGLPRPKTLILEWTDPAFSAGHWVPDLVEAAGGSSVLANPGANSVGVEWDSVRSSEAEVVVVSPCGFGLDGAADLAATVIESGHLPPKAEVWAIDADAYIVRPGPRVVQGVEALATILHPDAVGVPDPSEVRRLR